MTGLGALTRGTRRLAAALLVAALYVVALFVVASAFLLVYVFVFFGA